MMTNGAATVRHTWTDRLADAPTAAAAACAPLLTADPREKSAAALALAEAWRAGRWLTLSSSHDPAPPDAPARPAAPRIARPRELPKRSAHTPAGRIALLHAVAHIELNAIDLACDLVARFAADGAFEAEPDQPDQAVRRAFINDWLHVAEDEARHFTMVCDRLADYDAVYGDLPAHGGLWAAARDTAHDLSARLAVAPLMLEARGLDASPAMITALNEAGDEKSAAVVATILTEEISHVAKGARWFRHVCGRRGVDPREAFAAAAAVHAPGVVKPPFNRKARGAADVPECWYMDVAAHTLSTSRLGRDREMSKESLVENRPAIESYAAGTSKRSGRQS